MMSLLRIVIAIFLVGHGIGHIMGFLGTWTSWQPFAEPSFNESPWIFSDGIFIHSPVGKVFGIFWLQDGPKIVSRPVQDSSKRDKKVMHASS